MKNPISSLPSRQMRTGAALGADHQAITGKWLAHLGLLMRRYRGVIIAVQWLVVLVYLGLVITPAFLSLPAEQSHLWDNLTRFARFMFWGIWWPFVILSIMLFGRLWCGVLCPEGALTEWVSHYGLGKRIPRWIQWGGWPFVAFAGTTVFGQMISVYEYPRPALLILGGSTIAAIITGLLWGREKRVWCRHLCPVNGVFGLLAKISPIHFKVDESSWENALPGQRTSSQRLVDCAPLIDVRRMKSASACHMCGRCAGERNAVTLALRSPNAEILRLASQKGEVQKPGKPHESWSAYLIIYGLLGLALGAFQWSASPWFITGKQTAAAWLLGHQINWPFIEVGHWWLFTHYPEVNDVFSWLDGGMLLVYIATEACLIGSWLWLCLKFAGQLSRVPWQRLAHTLIPFAGASVFTGLSLLTTTQLQGEGMQLSWVNDLRILLLATTGIWSVSLAWRFVGCHRATAALSVALAISLPFALWGTQFFIW